MRILVTGAAGFIGSNFVKFILEKHPDYQIKILDKITYAGDLNNLKDVKGKSVFINGDICDKSTVLDAMKDVDIVINFAAETSVDKSIVNAEEFIKTNVFGTYTLLESARKLNIKKFIQISTDEVYGSLNGGQPFKETDSLNPSNPYSASKSAADMLCNSYYLTYKFPVVTARPANNYGPYQHPEKFIPKAIIHTLLDKPIPLYGDGSHVRDWIFVMDNCEAIKLVMENGKEGETYNISSNIELSNITVAKIILKLLSRKESLIKFVNDRLGHDKRYSLDSSKIRELGWNPKTDFEDGLKKTIEFYVSRLGEYSEVVS